MHQRRGTFDVFGDVAVEFDQARLDVLRQNRRRGAGVGANIDIFSAEIVLETVVIDDDGDGDSRILHCTHELAGAALVVDQDAAFINRKVFGLDGLDGPALEGDARQFDKSNVFLMTEGSGIDDIGEDVEFLGDQLIGPGRRQRIWIREILKNDDLPFASVPIERRTEFFEFVLLLRRSQHFVGRSDSILLAITIAIGPVSRFG